ncbi:MAG: glycosyltransferase family 39 protein [Anaerolineae bacterium]|nr:glycosyltransferase family 39 protein [Anaerolineae bacterium]
MSSSSSPNSPTLPPDTPPARGTPPRRWWALLPLLLGVLCLGALAWVNAFPASDAYMIGSITSREQLALLYAGMALVAWGIAGAPPFWRGLRQRQFSAARRGELLVLLLITLGALALRLIGLETTLRLLLDESNYVNGAARAIADTHQLILFPMSGHGPFPWLYPLLQADTVALFGHNLTGMRGASALIGAANVVVVYWIARQLFDRRTAVFSAILLAVYPPHLHFSRIMASLTIADALAGSVCLAFVIRALRTRQPLDWALAGVTFGLTHYFSDGGKLVFTPLVLVYLAWLAIMNREARRAIRGGIPRMMIAALLVAAPIYTTLYAHQRPVFGRWEDASGSGLSYWLNLPQDGLTEAEINEASDRLLLPFRFLVSEPEPEHIYYAGTEPLVMRALVPLLALGSLAALTRWRRAAVLPLAWALAVILGNGMFIRNPASSPRYVVAFPALAMLLALGVAAVYGLLARLRLPVGWTRAAAALLTGAAAVVQVAYYFGPHLDHLRTWHRRHLTYGDVWDATLRVYEQLPYATQGIYIGKPAPPGIESSELLGFYQNGNLYPFLGYEPSVIAPPLLRDLPRDRGYAFFVETRHSEAIQMLYRFFSDAAPPSYSTWDIAPYEQYLLIYVPPLS